MGAPRARRMTLTYHVLWVVGMIINTYDPLAAADMTRLQRIELALHHAAIIGLTGTQRKQHGETHYDCRFRRRHWAIEWGLGATQSVHEQISG